MSCLFEQWGLEFSPDEIADCRERQGLLSLELELSRACNLRCVYCYNSSGAALKNELTLKEIFSVIDQAAALGARKIIILGGGEPLLYPELFSVIKHVVASGLQADLFTNGTMITPEIAEKLFTLKVAVSIKMNSLDSATQDYLAGCAGCFEKIKHGINALLDAGYPNEDHLLGVESIICKQNYEEIPEMWRWAREKGIVPYFEVLTVQGRALDHKELVVDQPELRKLFENLSIIDDSEFGRKWTPLPPLAASQCARHEYSCTITTIGDVYPCPGVSLSTGNIRDNALDKILHSSQVINELRNIRKNIKGKCFSCKYKDACYGCRGNSYHVTGDYLAEDPTCWINN